MYSMTCLFMMASKSQLMIVWRLPGLCWEEKDRLPAFLKTGHTLDTFHGLGTDFSFKQLLNNFAGIRDNTNFMFLTDTGIFFGPFAFLVTSSFINLETSCTVMVIELSETLGTWEGDGICYLILSYTQRQKRRGSPYLSTSQPFIIVDTTALTLFMIGDLPEFVRSSLFIIRLGLYCSGVATILISLAFLRSKLRLNLLLCMTNTFNIQLRIRPFRQCILTSRCDRLFYTYLNQNYYYGYFCFWSFL